MTPVTFVPMTVLIVVVPAPAPALITVPLLLTLVVESVIAPVELASRIRLPVPTTPPEIVVSAVPFELTVVPLPLTLRAVVLMVKAEVELF